jgi:hypothetical protein
MKYLMASILLPLLAPAQLQVQTLFKLPSLILCHNCVETREPLKSSSLTLHANSVPYHYEERYQMAGLLAGYSHPSHPFWCVTSSTVLGDSYCKTRSLTLLYSSLTYGYSISSHPSRCATTVWSLLLYVKQFNPTLSYLVVFHSIVRKYVKCLGGYPAGGWILPLFPPLMLCHNCVGSLF